MRQFAERHPKWYLVLRAAAGVALASVAGAGFAAIAEDLPEKGAMVRVDTAVASHLEHFGTESGESLFAFVSSLGSTVLVALIGVVLLVLLWKRDWFRASALAITTAGGAILNQGLKVAFQRMRPPTATEFIHTGSWSFPSGHSMESLVGYGFLAFLLLGYVSDRRWRVAIIAFTVLLVGTVGFSRMYLGVHYLTDVIAGFLAGTVWLLACMGGYEFARHQHARGRLV
ncbi:MAG: phosphatase PAP2 family protein [Gemmatimonadaceae bacterium]